jgi:hypothetical protein
LDINVCQKSVKDSIFNMGKSPYGMGEMKWMFEKDI